MRSIVLLLALLAMAQVGAASVAAEPPRDQRAQAQADDQPTKPGRGRKPPSAASSQDSGRPLAERANAAYQRGRYIQSERLYRRLLETREQRGGDAQPPLPLILAQLGTSVAEQGRYAEAEPLLRRALAAAEREFGADSVQVAAPLTGLGRVLQQQGRSLEAEPLLRRALALRERLAPDTMELSATLNELAVVLRMTRRHAESEVLIRRALAIREAKLGPDHPTVAMTLGNLAAAVRPQGRLDEAAQLTERAVQITEKRLGPNNPRLAATLNAQGNVKLQARDFAGAEALFQRAAEIRERSLGPRHPLAAESLGGLAMALMRQERTADALKVIRRATEIQRARREGDEQRYDEGVESERRSARWLFQRHVAIAYQAWLAAAPTEKPALMDEAFEMAQWAQAGGVAGALARMSARFASGSGPLAALVRERQDALARRQALDRSLIESLSRPAPERDATEEDGARSEVAELDRRLSALDQRIEKEFPAYAELAVARPLTLARVRELTAPDEALLVYLIRSDDVMFWVVRRDGAMWYRVQDTGASYSRAIKALRAALNPAENRAMAPPPVGQAHKLYRELVEPAEPLLAGAKHLIVVPDGPLQSLPFGLLSTTDARKGARDYRIVGWLLRKYAISVLPSVSSLQALRSSASSARDREPFAGFGDPVLAGGGKAAAPAGRSAVHRGFVSESRVLRQLEPLPESAKELAELARRLKAPPGRVWTRHDATETKVKSTDLARFRVLAFATHGLMAGEFLDFAEPSLVLTPPASGTPEDDGLLSASEVAQLKLDADWVILSACNTAAPDATPGAEGLSGLAKAFFYAGARSLLVSNWYVASDAAVRLTTGAVAALERERGIGRAEALRRSMLAMLDDPATPESMTHPMFWAPFALVGEGGAGR